MKGQPVSPDMKLIMLMLAQLYEEIQILRKELQQHEKTVADAVVHVGSSR